MTGRFKSQADQNKQILQTVVFLIPLYIFIYFVFGLYFGWVDDVFMINYLKGTFYSKPDNALFIDTFLGWSVLFKKLYLRLPSVPWYEIAEYLVLGAAIIRFNILIINSSLLNLYRFPGFRYFAITVLNIALFLHLVQLSTFTSVCILASAVFLTSFFTSLSENNRKLTLLYFILFTVAFLIRPSLALPVVIIITVVFAFMNRKKILTVFPIVVVVAGAFFAQYINADADTQTLRAVHSRAIYLLDGQNSPVLKDSKMDSDLRHEAFFTWFCGDLPVLYSDSFLRELEPENKIFYHYQYFKQDLLSELFRSAYFYNDAYGKYRNWWIRGFFLALILTLFVGHAVVTLKSRAAKIVVVIAFGFFIIAVVFIAGLMKMEERFFYPTSVGILFLLFSIGRESEASWFSKTFLVKKAIFLSIVIFAAVQIHDGYLAHRELENEYHLKGDFIKEINSTVKNKVVFFDTWSMACIHLKPFHTWNLSAENSYTCYGETWSNFLKPHMNYLATFCSDPGDIKTYFDCLTSKREVVFLISSYRARFLEKYLYQAHHLRIRFRKISSNDAFQKLNYSFAPDPHEFGLYQIEKAD